MNSFLVVVYCIFVFLKRKWVEIFPSIVNDYESRIGEKQLLQNLPAPFLYLHSADGVCYPVAHTLMDLAILHKWAKSSLLKRLMDSREFVELRKTLGKTQRQIANLLGISLKAVCSYEQGWRSIPTHVERQLLFLLSRKAPQQGGANCWELRNCPEEKKNKCSAWEFNAGQFCWFISGTLREGSDCKSWEKKMETCKTCEVMKNIRE